MPLSTISLSKVGSAREAATLTSSSNEINTIFFLSGLSKDINCFM